MKPIDLVKRLRRLFERREPVGDTLERMQHPRYDELASKLEKGVPPDTGFGKFPGGKK